MPIQWRPAMGLGNAMIDADHRYLISLINRVEEALNKSGEQDALSLTLDQLGSYTREHFGREEKVMQAIGYSRFEVHRQAHRELVTRLVKIRADIEATRPEETPSEEIANLVELLRDWLLEHVLKEDLLIKEPLSRYPEDFKG